MFEKTIIFSCRKEYLKTDSPKPEAIQLNIPKWYKEIEHTMYKRTIKGCIPFMETLTNGYLLKTPVEIHLKHNFQNGENRDSSFISGVQEHNNLIGSLNLNIEGKPEIHSVDQVGKCPVAQKNKDLPIMKIINPYTIKTPPGYSCLFVPPLNNVDDRFSIIPAIVDTDTFPSEINFPFVVNGDKYPILETTIKIGTPYVQIIPFKRDNWKMKIKSETLEENNQRRLSQEKHILHNYKQRWWNKKKWK